MRLFVYI